VLGWLFRAQRQQQLEELEREREYRYEVIDLKIPKSKGLQIISAFSHFSLRE